MPEPAIGCSQTCSTTSFAWNLSASATAYFNAWFENSEKSVGNRIFLISIMASLSFPAESGACQHSAISMRNVHELYQTMLQGVKPASTNRRKGLGPDQ